MDKRAAKREAHRWVSQVIDGALGNGAEDYFADNETDAERVQAAIRDLQAEHDRKGQER
jgi:hypothetical protein